MTTPLVNEYAQDNLGEGYEEGATKMVAEKIMHIFDMYPKLNPTMLQVSLGSGISADLWKPVLEKLIREGKLVKEQRQHVTPGGRAQSVIVLSKAEISQ